METVALPILMLTGLQDEAMESISLDAGADDNITKPVVPERLRARVAALLRQQQRMRRRA